MMLSNTHRCLVGCLVLSYCFIGCRAADYTVATRRDITGSDIDCGKKDYQGNKLQYCEISSGPAGVADACDANKDCHFFVMEGSYRGFLKKAGGQPTYREGYTTYCKLGGSRPCSGSYTFKRRVDIAGNDVNCNAKDYQGQRLSFCKVDGYVEQLASSCDANKDCKAFTAESGYGGYLKTAGTPQVYREGWNVYVKRS